MSSVTVMMMATGGCEIKVILWCVLKVEIRLCLKSLGQLTRSVTNFYPKFLLVHVGCAPISVCSFFIRMFISTISDKIGLVNKKLRQSHVKR